MFAAKRLTFVGRVDDPCQTLVLKPMVPPEFYLVR